MLDFFTGTEVTVKDLNNFIESINKYKYCHMKPKNSFLPQLYRINRVSNNQYKLTDYSFRDNQMLARRTTKPMDKSDLRLCLIYRHTFS